MKTTIHFALFDSRYTYDPFEAICYTVCQSIKEARKEKREDFPDAIIVKQTNKETAPRQYTVIKSEIVD